MGLKVKVIRGMERQNKHSIQEPIVIVDDDSIDSSDTIKAVKNKHWKRAGHHNKSKRKVKVETTEDKETLIITQKVEVREIKSKCIINLTNICEHKKNPAYKKSARTNIPKDNKSSVLKKSSRLLKANQNLTKERIVPQCMRKSCLTKTSRCLNNKHKHGKETSKKKERSGKKATNCLSPISSLEEKISDITYENVSSGSFHSDDELELETLIKRTRERERKLSLTLDNLPPASALPSPLCSSTPLHMENDPDVITVDNSTVGSSDMDISLHSLATLVLEPQLDMYSPTQPTESLENDPEFKEETIDYSPVKHTSSQVIHEYSTIDDNMNLPWKSLGFPKLEPHSEETEESISSKPLDMSNLKVNHKNCDYVKTEISENIEGSGIENEMKLHGSNPKQLKLEECKPNLPIIKSESAQKFELSDNLNNFKTSPCSIKIESDLNDNILSQESLYT